MDHTCLVVPLLPGKEEALRAFYRDVNGPRQEEFDQSEQRMRDMVSLSSGSLKTAFHPGSAATSCSIRTPRS